MFETIIIGKGLIGSAAARYLSEISQSVALIGPDEPADWPAHSGVFASHYDQGRITRVLDADPVWATLAQRSLAQYAVIERQSGLTFHYPVGGLKMAQHPEAVQEALTTTERIGRQLQVEFTPYTANRLQTVYPWLNVDCRAQALFEPSPAGYIHPRALVAAQVSVAEKHGASIIRDTVVAVKESKDGVEVRSVQGKTYQARTVLIATGAYTNSLLERPLALIPIARTILLAEVPAREVDHFREMPTLIAWLPEDAPIASIYLLPPLQYPDGRYYLKIGGGDSRQPLLTVQSLTAWFHSEGSQMLGQTLKAVLLSLLPRLKPTCFQTKPCVTTHTSSGYPFLDAVTARIFVAAGGCGYAAKSSNEIGRLAAQLVAQGRWTDSLDRTLFKARLP